MELTTADIVNGPYGGFNVSTISDFSLAPTGVAVTAEGPAPRPGRFAEPSEGI